MIIGVDALLFCYLLLIYSLVFGMPLCQLFSVVHFPILIFHVFLREFEYI